MRTWGSSHLLTATNIKCNLESMEFSDKVSKSHPGKYRIQTGKCSVCACVFRTLKDSEDDGYPTSKLRSELGESLATVRNFDVPLAQATTSSLDALKNLWPGSIHLDKKGELAPIF